MIKFNAFELSEINDKLRDKSPEEIVTWTLDLSENRLVTTNFGVYSAVLLNTFHHLDSNIKVIWCDTGYNSPETYRHAIYLRDVLELNVHQYAPLQTSAYTDVALGVPDVDDPNHAQFTEIVKLEPFRRALKEHQA
ncbi:MAG: phosphoadenosine phosphosulfate reductase family protein [Flavobacteriaceae bacterium]|nr:phosphoadenosine phosphosulfate reductase family protein [Flavobacteriaceae bacterium]